MNDYYDYSPQVELSGPIVVSGYLADFTRSVTYRAASLLGLAFHDIDRLVEHEAARDVGRLVLEEGESAYRELESESLKRALRERPPGLIALGDGSLLNQENRALVESEARLIILDFDLANLFWRVQKLARDLDPAPWHAIFAGVPEDLDQIRPFYQQRQAAFEEAPTKIDANALGKSKASRALIGCVEALSQ